MPTQTKAKTKNADAQPKKPTGRIPMSEAAIVKSLKKLDGWTFTRDTLEKTFSFNSYLAGLAFATAVGTIAESYDHHPDMLVKWRSVTISFSTHDAGNKVTAIDFKLAEAIETLPYKPKV